MYGKLCFILCSFGCRGVSSSPINDANWGVSVYIKDKWPKKLNYRLEFVPLKTFLLLDIDLLSESKTKLKNIRLMCILSEDKHLIVTAYGILMGHPIH